MENKRPVGTFRPVHRSVVKQISTPDFINVPTSLRIDEVCFYPQRQENGHVAVFANVNEILSIGSGDSTILDCGIHIDLPRSYRIVGSMWKDLAMSGLILSTVTVENGRVVLMVSNFGKKEIQIERARPIATLALEPIHYFSWE